MLFQRSEGFVYKSRFRLSLERKRVRDGEGDRGMAKKEVGVLGE